MVVFAVQNLIKDPPFTKLDLLSCRNLLIYLSRSCSTGWCRCSTTRSSPAACCCSALRDRSAASPICSRRSTRSWKIFRRRQAASGACANGRFPAAHGAALRTRASPARLGRAAGRPSRSLASACCSTSFVPPSVVISERGDWSTSTAAPGSSSSPPPASPEPQHPQHGAARGCSSTLRGGAPAGGRRPDARGARGLAGQDPTAASGDRDLTRRAAAEPESCAALSW